MTLESKGAQRSIESGPERIRISVANIIRRIRVNETGESYYPAILNLRSLAKGERKYQAIGGGAKMVPSSIERLKASGAEFGPKDSEENDDARFEIPADKFQQAFDTFAKLDPDSFESDPLREVREELSEEEFPGIGKILSEEEAREIEVDYAGALCQVPDTLDTSHRASKTTPTRRLFHLFDMQVPKHVFDKMQKSPALKLLSEAELQNVTMQHAREGKSLWEVTDAQGEAVIANNIFPPDFSDNIESIT